MHAPDRSTHAMTTAITNCGNYCVVGTRGGVIYMYNLQSGLARGAFPFSATAPTISKGNEKLRTATPGNVMHDYKEILNMYGEFHGAGALTKNDEKTQSSTAPAVSEQHTGDVTGVFVDMTNTVLASCGLDGKLIFWDFVTHAVLHVVTHSCAQLRMVGFRDGNFVALVGQDRIVRVYDLSSYKLSRRFEGHGREVTDIAFTPDGRRIITSSLDATIRVYDMPTGRCLSWMSFDAPIVSLCVSHSGEYLCVAQADKEGIYMYIDKSMYETVHFWREPSAPTPVADSRVLIEGEDNAEDAADEIVMEVTEENAKYIESTAQKAAGSITLSSVAKAYWVSLFHLEAIKARNKPKEPLAPPPNVPFFLPTIKHGGATPSFPTPAEYKAMTAKAAEPEKDVGEKRKAEAEVEEEVVDFSGMTSVWDDAGEDATEEEEVDGEEVGYVIDTKPQSSSRIIRKKTVLPR